MKKIIVFIFLIFSRIGCFSQNIEIISKKRAIEICDSLKKIEGHSFDHILKTAWFFENTEEYRDYFFYCINAITNGYQIPTQQMDENGFPIGEESDYLIDWHGKGISEGCLKGREKFSLGDKIYIYYNLPKPFEQFTDGIMQGPDPYESNDQDVYIGYICDPKMCKKPDDRPKITRD